MISRQEERKENQKKRIITERQLGEVQTEGRRKKRKKDFEKRSKKPKKERKCRINLFQKKNQQHSSKWQSKGFFEIKR